MTTFLALAEYSKLEFKSFDCTAEGILEKVEGKFLMTEITLHPVLTIADADKTDRALRLMEKAESACLISNSIKTTVKLDAKVNVPETI
jgi:organic hydroperoxide reductase OsmC/OhrA